MASSPKHGHVDQEAQDHDIDYSQRSQWLRAAVLGANDGLVSVASLMMGVGAVKKDVKAMFLIGFAGLIAGACSMAIGEFVSVYSQLDIEVSQMKRDQKEADEEEGSRDVSTTIKKEKLPNPMQAALASALAFSLGAIVPLLAAAFIGSYKARLATVSAAVSLALVIFGGVGAVLGGSSPVSSCVRVLFGGWMAMGITFGLSYRFVHEYMSYTEYLVNYRPLQIFVFERDDQLRKYLSKLSPLYI